MTLILFRIEIFAERRDELAYSLIIEESSFRAFHTNTVFEEFAKRVNFFSRLNLTISLIQLESIKACCAFTSLWVEIHAIGIYQLANPVCIEKCSL